MLIKAITFDIQSPAWMNDRQYKHCFLRAQENYIKDILKERGYIYLNQIYELLDVRWNPDDDNLCFKYDGVNLKKLIEFEVFDQEDNSILIHILYRK